MTETEERNGGPGILVRGAALGDAEWIFGLVMRNSDRLVPRSLGSIVESIDRFVVAEADGKRAGCASYQIHPEIGVPEAATVEIVSLAVDAALRRAGAGRALVLEIVRRVRQFGPREAVVLTYVPEFFATLGFREVPKTKIMHKLYTGCMNCTKHADPFTCPETAMVLDIG